MKSSAVYSLSPAEAQPAPARSAPPVVWTIAGHDPSSGAGITADLATFSAFDLFGVSVVTALTAQSTLGVAAVHPVPAAFLAQTLDHLHADLPPAGIKIGMLGSTDAVTVVADFLHRALSQRHSNSNIPIIMDPVLRSSSGAELLPAAALEALLHRLLPLATAITPNRRELAVLSSLPITREDDVRSAADRLASTYPHLTILATGGDAAAPVDILRLPGGAFHRYAGTHIESRSTHGTGCVFSSALLAALVQGTGFVEAVAIAKRFVEQGIQTAPSIGHGTGPLNLIRKPS